MTRKILLVGLLSTLAGCAGVEAFSSLGVRRIDEHKQEQATYARNTKPLMCWFWNGKGCSNMEGEQSGS